MFKKVASDLLGLSDIGSVIKPQDYDKVDADDYIISEDGEKIYFLIKSKTDEYCFTNQALIHLDGTSATSKKRTLRRYSYYNNKISNVMIETAGTVDLDIELKFRIGKVDYSIDIHKRYIDEIKDLYKALIKLGEITSDNDAYFGFAKQSLDLASKTLNRHGNEEKDLVEQFKKLNQYTFSWMMQARQQYRLKDYGFVFERYIHNK
jgi:hypothetical protein